VKEAQKKGGFLLAIADQMIQNNPGLSVLFLASPAHRTGWGCPPSAFPARAAVDVSITLQNKFPK
jgi:hypothetical protein